MPRLTYFAGLALVLLAGAFLLTDELTWRPGVTERNVRRVRVGMTGAQVEAILGQQTEVTIGDDLGGWLRCVWPGKDGWAFVEFGTDGRVMRHDPAAPFAVFIPAAAPGAPIPAPPARLVTPRRLPCRG